MLKHLLAPFLLIDRFFQHLVDSCCFFLMRRFGIRKSMIRYGLNALFIVSWIGALLSLASYGLLKGGHILFCGLMLTWLLISQRAEVLQDREAERRPGMASRVDRDAGMQGSLKCLTLYFIADEVWQLFHVPAGFLKAGLVDGQHHLSCCCNLVTWSAFLLLRYLKKTPMNPPPAKETVGILAPKTHPAAS